MNNTAKTLFKILFIIILFIAFLCISACSYAFAVSNNISDTVFRLHIIANSDSEADQNLKYKVRDNLLDYMNTLITSNMSKDDIVQTVNAHINEFTNIAETTIKSEGYNYSIDISIDKCNFPTKKYGDVCLPAGDYDALRVKIGSASGHNWWCVMFPPLCFVDVSSGIVSDDSKETLKDSLGDEEYKLITADTSNTSGINVKFKIVELVEQIKSKL